MLHFADVTVSWCFHIIIRNLLLKNDDKNDQQNSDHMTQLNREIRNKNFQFGFLLFFGRNIKCSTSMSGIYEIYTVCKHEAFFMHLNEIESTDSGFGIQLDQRIKYSTTIRV